MKVLHANTYRLVCYIALLIAVPFFYVTAFVDPYLHPKLLLLCLAEFGLIGYLIFQEYQKGTIGKSAIFSSAFALCFAAFLLLEAITLAYSVNFQKGMFLLVKDLNLFLLILLLWFAVKDGSSFFNQVAKIGTILTLLLWIHGLWQFYEVNQSFELSHQATYQVKGTFGHRNLFGHLLLLSLPFNFFNFIKNRGLWHTFSAVNISLAVALIITLLARSIWIALVGATLLTLIVSLIANKGTLQNFKSGSVNFLKQYKLYLGFFLVVVTLAIWGYSRLGTLETFEKQAESLFHFHYGSVENRLKLYEHSFNMFTNSPLKGIGLGSWNLEVLSFGPQGLESKDQVTFYQRPHNDFLWVLSESGGLAFIAYAGAFLVLLYYTFQLLKNNHARQQHFTLIMVVFFGLTAYLLLAMFSFPRERVSHSIVLAIFVVPLLKLHFHQYRQKLSKSSSYIFLISAGLMVALSAYIISMQAQGQYYTLKAFENRNNNQWNALIHNASQAGNSFYTMDPMSTPISWYTGLAYYNLRNIDVAMKHFQDAYEVNPHHIHVLNNLATCHQIKGNHQQAIQLYEKAVQIDSSFTDARLNLAASYYNRDKIEKAYHHVSALSMEEDQPEKIKRYAHKILQAKLANIQQEVDEAMMSDLINIIGKDKGWLLNIHEKSQKEKRSLKAQVIKDVIYALEKIDKKITFEKADSLKKKYNLKN